MALPASILVVGGGGREHALVRALGQSPGRPRLICAPGNAGIAAEIPCFPVAVEDIAGLVALARREKVDFVVVGPELPLALGLVDALLAAGIPAFGPKADGAKYEASKIATKALLRKYRIPTAAAESFDEIAPALAYLRSQPAPIVVKADGLAAGKGVVVAATAAEAEAGARALLGAPGSRILIEECLGGDETSLLVVVSGQDYIMLPTAQDHKRIGENDTGPNTGGMGAYSPAGAVTPAVLARIESEIVRPSVRAIAAEGVDFRGILFIGIMLTPDGPKVLEYNTRFGDPETQAILPRLTTDLLALLWAAARGTLSEVRLQVRPDPAVCVVVAARGYPNAYLRGDPIRLPAALPPATAILHAGTGPGPAGAWTAQGGRVLGVVASAPTLGAALERAYAACDQIDWANKYYRRDIGGRQLGVR